MWVILLLICVGFILGIFLDVPFSIVDRKYLVLIFLALLDGLTYSLARDLSGVTRNNGPVLIRFMVAVIFGCFVLYYGEKSSIDLYFVAYLPLVLGISANVYKFLPK